MLVAGNAALAKLSTTADGWAQASVNGMPPVLVQPRAKFSTFAAARNAPLFYGATEEGGIVAVACCVQSNVVICSPAPRICEIHVKAINAAAHLTLIFTDAANCVWMINLEEPLNLQQVGRAERPIVTAFAAADVAVVVLAHATKATGLTVLSLRERYHWTWTKPDKDTCLNPPDWATCCVASLQDGIATTFIGGLHVAAVQLEARLAGPPRLSTNRIGSSVKAPVRAIAYADEGSAVLCLLKDQRLIKLTSRGRSTVMANCSALSDTGHTPEDASPVSTLPLI